MNPYCVFNIDYVWSAHGPYISTSETQERRMDARVNCQMRWRYSGDYQSDIDWQAVSKVCNRHTHCRACKETKDGLSQMNIKLILAMPLLIVLVIWHLAIRGTILLALALGLAVFMPGMVATKLRKWTEK